MAPSELFEYLLKKYYRRPLVLPVKIFIQLISEKPPEVRRQMAEHCHYPELIELLAGDKDPLVSGQARRNEYWRHVGQYKRLLGLSREEKIEFIHRDGFPVIMLFVLFETDLKILREVFEHPGVSLRMLNIFRRHLISRKDEMDVRPLLELIQSVLTIRSRRIIQVTEVFQHSRDLESEKSLRKIFPFVLDDDSVVVRSAVNVMKQFEYAVIRKIIFLKNPLGDGELNSQRIWLFLNRLKQYYKISDATLEDSADFARQKPLGQKMFFDDVSSRKLLLLEYCSENLNDADNLVTLAMAHLDGDARITDRVKNVMHLEELLALVSDPSFPQATSFKIMAELKQHPSKYVQRRISEIFLEIYERTRQRLREMEISITAYFDIIFNSLGNPQIQQIRQAFKVLDSAKKLTGGFIDQSDENFAGFDTVYELFGKIAEFYQKKLVSIYLDIDESRLRELTDVYEILMMIQQIPQEFVEKEGYLPGQNPEEYRRISNSTKTIWRSTLGQYLGRLRELDEMVRRKWLNVVRLPEKKKLLKREMGRAVQTLEKDYRAEMECKLKISCSACGKRACASEKFLRQVEFFLGELLDFIAGEQTAPLRRAFPEPLPEESLRAS